MVKIISWLSIVLFFGLGIASYFLEGSVWYQTGAVFIGLCWIVRLFFGIVYELDKTFPEKYNGRNNPDKH
jgi:hypothetical protein